MSIPPRTTKRAAEERRYNYQRKIFLQINRVCPVAGGVTTEIHHMKGREGYADQWARDNDLPLLLDERWWLAVSHDGHVEIEKNPEWAYQMGYSLSRTEVL